MQTYKKELEHLLVCGNTLIISGSDSLTHDLLTTCKKIHEEKSRKLIFIEKENTLTSSPDNDHLFISLSYLKQNFQHDSLTKKDYDHIILYPFIEEVTLTLLNAFILYETGNIGAIQASSIPEALDKLIDFASWNCRRREESDTLIYGLINLTFRHIIVENNNRIEIYKFHENDFNSYKNSAYTKYLERLF